MRYLLGMPVKEIAEETGLDEANIYKRIDRARKQSKIILGEKVHESLKVGESL